MAELLLRIECDALAAKLNIAHYAVTITDKF